MTDGIYITVKHTKLNTPNVPHRVWFLSINRWFRYKLYNFLPNWMTFILIPLFSAKLAISFLMFSTCWNLSFIIKILRNNKYIYIFECLYVKSTTFFLTKHNHCVIFIITPLFKHSLLGLVWRLFRKVKKEQRLFPLKVNHRTFDHFGGRPNI